MRSRPTGVLVLGGALFLLSVVFFFLWMGGSSGLFLWLGLGTLCLSVLSLAVAGRWMAKKPDPLETRREQQLWRSGPLGRRWLKRRKRLP